ncbi:uncharacterized protein N7529_001749 [Penicillium soppii]|uniref:uncharacterized protein n=1 Tax=Penicillium soppii TaxID=69789 RepID=UPI00254660DE|nr:uncharacterized protein N7529_001749 [Penicillium soppii]KAJ5876165.1 hypothetical protein N7529_001749 [Penicillium soppii]
MLLIRLVLTKLADRPNCDRGGFSELQDNRHSLAIFHRFDTHNHNPIATNCDRGGFDNLSTIGIMGSEVGGFMGGLMGMKFRLQRV